MKELPTSAPIPAGQTRPIRIPKGSKLSVEPVNPEDVIGGNLKFYYNGVHKVLNYPLNDIDRDKTYDFELETGCFYNESTVNPPKDIKVSAHSWTEESDK